MRSHVDGPVHVFGNRNPVINENPEAGPSLVFQGGSLYDPRFAGNAGAAPSSVRDYGIYLAPYAANVDGVPQAIGIGRIAAAQAAAQNQKLNLATVQAAGLSIAIPVMPWANGLPQKIDPSQVVKALALDFGFATCNVVQGSKNVTNLPAWAWRLMQGMKNQPVIIAGAGAAANTPLFTTISAVPVPGGTTFTIADAAGQTINNTQIGTADPTGVAAWPYTPAGTDVALADPTQMLARAVSITGNAGSAAGNFTVVGYDIWGNPQTEKIAFAGGAVTTNGKKAFKYIVSVTPDFTDAGHTFSVDTTDIFGFQLRSDFWEYANVYWAGAFQTVSNGWTAADGTNPATNVTGDSRGTYNVQSVSDGAKRLAIFATIPAASMINANNLNFATLFGVTPA